MLARHTPWLIALAIPFGLAGCTDPANTDDDKLVIDSVDSWIDWPDDTGDTGTDEDTDGWSVEDGDCDDNNIYVNPGRDEDPDDGLDNDCDLSTDEGVRNTYYDDNDGDQHGEDHNGSLPVESHTLITTPRKPPRIAHNRPSAPSVMIATITGVSPVPMRRNPGSASTVARCSRS